MASLKPRLEAQRKRQARNHTRGEGRRLKGRGVTGTAPESQRSTPGQGEARRMPSGGPLGVLGDSPIPGARGRGERPIKLGDSRFPPKWHPRPVPPEAATAVESQMGVSSV